MLATKIKPFNPNRKQSAGSNWDKDDLKLYLNNLDSIPSKDLNVTNKSLEYFKKADKTETIAEIITTFNLTYYKVLSGLRGVLELNDRIIHITEGRNKSIGYCIKKNKEFDARISRIDFLLAKAVNIIPDTNLNEYKKHEKLKNIFEITSCRDISFTDVDFNVSELNITENIHDITETKQNNTKSFVDPYISSPKDIIIGEINCIDTSPTSVTLPYKNLTAIPRQVNILNNEIDNYQSQLKIQNQIQTETISLPNNQLKVNYKTKKIKNNHKKSGKKKKTSNGRKKYQNKKKKNNKQKQKYQTQKKLIQPSQEVYCGRDDQDLAHQSLEVDCDKDYRDCGKYAQMVAKTIEMDKIMAKYQAKQQNKKSFNNGDVD